MLALTHRIGAIIGILLFAGVASAANDVTAIKTPRTGKLTKCASRLFYQDCNEYHHIKVPRRIKLGDHVRLTYGSNPKSYNFPVARISRDGDTCTLYSEESGDPEKMDRIEITSCTEWSGTP